MRKYHRWLSVFFSVFILFIGVTGVMIQLADLKAESEPRPTLSATPTGFVCPPEMSCRPKPAPGGAKQWSGFIKELHSGEEFGPAGTVLSILSGLALTFFAFSGLWMYVQMFRNRAARSLKPGWFWK